MTPNNRGYKEMKRAVLSLIAAILLTGTATTAFGNRDGEFLTEAEIKAIRKNQKIDPRVKLYLRYALLRLTSAQARMAGQETLPGDPLEYLTPEDMLDLRSVSPILYMGYERYCSISEA